MYVCICYGISESSLEQELQKTSLKEAIKNLKIGKSCGICLKDCKNKITNLEEKCSTKSVITKISVGDINPIPECKK